ncbi:7862_t:CDS:2 [Ambispora gerdemannii]|uniref:7862_t:CDS:1 n=1 Tax=Ambispora gerdemannii TaxID=144530 RepID=A0A9N8V0J5_9GLOM|nr:7862_t:CDS:2 [Ambispora gerdemannii]
MASTSVRVALRVRPMNKHEVHIDSKECVTLVPDAPQIMIGSERSFTYDYVYSSDTAQEDVFGSSAKPLVDKLIEGFNTTILAYGQTGSGKTYSMGTAIDGSSITPEHQGIVPRAITYLFRELEARQALDPTFKYEVAVSFLELYNEDLIDLLNPASHENHKKGNKSDTIHIREDSNGRIYWLGVKEVTVSSPEELLGQLQKGSGHRTVASTAMNAVSSRSHAIFTVILHQSRVEDPEADKENNPALASEDQPSTSKKSKKKARTTKITSKFNFVDLAGSERMKRTKATGDRAKEGIAINGGLLALGNVISALGDESKKAIHVPYRDSKLTRLLQDSLGGNSHTLMLACISPADTSFCESLNTLKYANRARNIKNLITVNEEYGESSAEVIQLRQKLAKLEAEITNLRAGGVDETVKHEYEEQIKELRGIAGQEKLKRCKLEAEMHTVCAERDAFAAEIKLFEEESGSYTKMPRTGLSSPRKTSLNNNHGAGTSSPRKTSLNNVTNNNNHHITFADDDAGEGSRYHENLREEGHHDNYYNGHDEGNSEAPESSHDAANNKENTETPRRLRRTARDTIEQAREQIKQGLLFLKNGGSKPEDPLLSRLINTPSSTKSESYIDQMIKPNTPPEKRRSGSVSFSDVQTIEVPAWEESTPPQPVRRSSGSSRSVSFSDQQISPHSTKSSSQNSTGNSSQQQNAITLQRMLHQIQADIEVKEQLVSQLERAEEEFTAMRIHYDNRITAMNQYYEEQIIAMRDNIVSLERERDAALKRGGGGSISTRDKASVIQEMKMHYEHKLKKLSIELLDLNKKYHASNHAHQLTKSQNDSAVKSMKGQLEQLKAEKIRMGKSFKDDADKIREMTERKDREIENLRRKEKVAQKERKRIERAHESQRLVLEKRNREVLQINNKLKAVMLLLKRTSTPKAIAKVFRGKRPNKVVPVPKDDIHSELFLIAKEKRRSIDQALDQFVYTKGSSQLLDELYRKKEELVHKQQTRRNEREHIDKEYLEVYGNLDLIVQNERASKLDGEIELLQQEISLISAQIRAIHDNVGNYKPEGIQYENGFGAAIKIMKDLDPFEQQTLLESYLEDVVGLRTKEWSHEVKEQHYEKILADLRQKLILMREAGKMTTFTYEEKIKNLEEQLGTRLEDGVYSTHLMFDKIYQSTFDDNILGGAITDSPTLSPERQSQRPSLPQEWMENGQSTRKLEQEANADIDNRRVLRLRRESQNFNRERRDSSASEKDINEIKVRRNSATVSEKEMSADSIKRRSSIIHRDSGYFSGV